MKKLFFLIILSSCLKQDFSTTGVEIGDPGTKKKSKLTLVLKKEQQGEENTISLAVKLDKKYQGSEIRDLQLRIEIYKVNEKSNIRNKLGRDLFEYSKFPINDITLSVPSNNQDHRFHSFEIWAILSKSKVGIGDGDIYGVLKFDKENKINSKLKYQLLINNEYKRKSLKLTH